MDKSTISLETDRDKDISTLSYTKAKCLINLKAGFCSCNECANCRTGQRFTACYESLPVCDQLRVDNDAIDIAGVMYLQQGRVVNDGRILRIIPIVITILAVLGIIWGILSICIGGRPMHVRPLATEVSELDRKRAFNMCEPVYNEMERIGVWDINNDNLINCIDNALVFKLLWDSMYTHSNCQLIASYNETFNWGHLFCRVRVDNTSPWVCIEPQKHTYNTFTNIVGSIYRDPNKDLERTTRWLMEIATGEISNQTWLKIKNIIGE